MSDFADSPSIILKRVRLDYFDAFKPGKPAEEGGESKYKAKAIIDPTQTQIENINGVDTEVKTIDVLKKAMGAAAKALWGANASQVVQAMTANSKCLRNGNHNLDQSGNIKPDYKDMYFISASNKSKPQVVGPKRVNGKFVDIHADGTCSIAGKLQDEPPYPIVVPYRGCYVNLKVTCTAGKTKQLPNKKTLPNQIFAKFEALQYVGEGVAFGAGPTSAEGFDDEEVEGDGDPMGGAGDDLMGNSGKGSMEDDISF